MSTGPHALAALGGPCGYCAGYHVGVCPRVQVIEYYEGGGVKRVVLRPDLPTIGQIPVKTIVKGHDLGCALMSGRGEPCDCSKPTLWESP